MRPSTHSLLAINIEIPYVVLLRCRIVKINLEWVRKKPSHTTTQYTTIGIVCIEQAEIYYLSRGFFSLCMFGRIGFQPLYYTK